MSTDTNSAVLSPTYGVEDTARVFYRLHRGQLWVEISTLAYEANLIYGQKYIWRYSQNSMFTTTEGTTNVLRLMLGYSVVAVEQ
jgi:hypothetical protein